MRYTVLERRLTRQPFEPFRIILTDGMEYDIRHPDQAIPSYAELEVLANNPNRRSSPPDFLVSLSYLHIMRIEPIAPDE